MLAADDPHIDNLEVAIEYGLRKPLTPRASAAQDPRGVEGNLGRRQGAIRVNHAGERFAVEACGNLSRESGSERRQVSLRQAHSSRHCVAAEFIDEVRVTRRNTFQSVADVDAGDGAGRAAQRTIFGARECNHRSMQPVFNPAGDQTHHALMPALVEQT